VEFLMTSFSSSLFWKTERAVIILVYTLTFLGSVLQL
jgi:hypothetical protein